MCKGLNLPIPAFALDGVEYYGKCEHCSEVLRSAQILENPAVTKSHVCTAAQPLSIGVFQQCAQHTPAPALTHKKTPTSSRQAMAKMLQVFDPLRAFGTLWTLLSQMY